jgi:magnesium transporter
MKPEKFIPGKPRFFKDRKQKQGLAPGSLIFIGNKKMEKAYISVMDWNADTLAELMPEKPSEIIPYLKNESLTWINLYGLHDNEIIREFGEILDISPLLLEDIMNTDQRPKYIEDDTTQGFILKVLGYDMENSRVHTDQISFVMGPGFVISFQEHKANLFGSIRDRIRNSKGRVRAAGPDYLVYILLDTLIDNYLDIIGIIGEQIEKLGRNVLIHPGKEIPNKIYHYRIEVNLLRKFIRPARELILQWMKSDTGRLQKRTKVFVQDLADLATQADENIEIYSNLLSDAHNIYNTNLNNRTNEIMKVLTLFAAIFIPLTFFTGIYGMNFEYMPELKYRYAYPIFLATVLLAGVGLYLFFKRKKWI